MQLHVLVTAVGPEQPPSGLPVVVEVRDTSQLDVTSTTVCSARAVTGAVDADHAMIPRETQEHEPVASVWVTVPDDFAHPDSLTVWARVASESHEHVTAGDWITVQAYPVHSEAVAVEIVLV